MSSERSRTRPDIDGLRAVAIIPVLLFHADLGFPGGFAGVDVFLVISGFLITSLIDREMEAGTFSLGPFWERRIRRIMPAVVVMTLAVLAAGWFLLLANDYQRLGRSVVAQVCGIANVFFWRSTGYETAGQTIPLLHSWSLAVEEQFYLFFPLVMLGCRRFKLPKATVALAFLLVSFALNLREFYAGSVSTSYFLLHTRAWELLMGSVLALALKEGPSKRWLAELAGWLGLVAIVVFCLSFRQLSQFPGWSALVPCLGTCLLLWANQRELTTTGRFLSQPVFRGIGLISYSLYLWHWPVLVLLREVYFQNFGMGMKVVAVLASFPLAWLSWKYVENPFRQRRLLVERRTLFTFAGVGTMVVGLCGFLVWNRQGFPSRLPAEANTYENDSNHRSGYTDTSLEDVRAGNLIKLGEAGKEPTVLVWGDSHARAVLKSLDREMQKQGLAGCAAVRSGTAPFLDYPSSMERGLRRTSLEYGEAVISYAKAQRISTVIVFAHWHPYVIEEGTRVVASAVNHTVQRLRSAGLKVVLFKDVADLPYSAPKALARASLDGGLRKLALPTVAEVKESHKFEDEVLDGLKDGVGVVVSDPLELLADDSGVIRIEGMGRSLYYDRDHLSLEGAATLEPLFAKVIRSMVEP